MTWHYMKDCPHEDDPCLNKNECTKKDKRAKKIVRHTITERQIRESWNDPEFADE